jgi:hypothetical protein
MTDVTISLPTPCIVCGVQPEPAFPTSLETDGKQTYNQPSKATNFESGGHYGSTFFDPMHGYDKLSLNVCDECLKRLCSEGKVLLERRTPKRPKISWSVYDPAGYES